MANRLLILQSFGESLSIDIETHSQDVIHLKKALEEFRTGKKEFHVGEGGTTIRFFLARLSRESGEFKIFASSRLLSRPQGELLRVLSNLGVEVICKEDHLLVKSQGWRPPKSETLEIDNSQSTQFASAILLSSLELNFPLKILFKNLEGSRQYLEMTLKMMQESGVRLNWESEYIEIEANQSIKSLPACEIDVSSAFSAVGCALAGRRNISINEFPEKSLQPDHRFVSLLQEMGVEIEHKEQKLFIRSSEKVIQPLKAQLDAAPDLFPVLSAICALSYGESELTGLARLQFKESNRLEKTKELLRLVGAEVTQIGGKLHIKGPINLKPVTFDPDQDHRMAMAATVLKAAGCSIKIQNPEVVNKSFPDFWKVVGINP